MKGNQRHLGAAVVVTAVLLLAAWAAWIAMQPRACGCTDFDSAVGAVKSLSAVKWQSSHRTPKSGQGGTFEMRPPQEGR